MLFFITNNYESWIWYSYSEECCKCDNTLKVYRWASSLGMKKGPGMETAGQPLLFNPLSINLSPCLLWLQHLVTPVQLCEVCGDMFSLAMKTVSQASSDLHSPPHTTRHSLTVSTWNQCMFPSIKVRLCCNNLYFNFLSSTDVRLLLVTTLGLLLKYGANIDLFDRITQEQKPWPVLSKSSLVLYHFQD